MSSLNLILKAQIVRELQTFIKEVEAFPSDDSLWHTRRGVTNSVGNLALHVCGNLQDFVGRVLGGSSYVRQRDLEFSRREGSRAEVVAELRKTIDAVDAALEALTPDAIDAEYPMRMSGRVITTGAFLVHLAAHLAFHLGQAGYLRRVITGDSTSTSPLPFVAISQPATD